MPVVDRELLGCAQRPAAGNDGRLVQWVSRGKQVGHQRMACLVVGRGAFLFVADDQRPALGTHQHLVLGHLEIFLGHRLPVVAGGAQRRLVHQVGQIGAAEARGPAPR